MEKSPHRTPVLVAAEFIGLSVIKGETEQIELGVLVHLKLDESVGQRTESFDHSRKLAKRHEPGDEDVAVPGLELQLGASSLKLHDQRIAFQRHRRLAEARIDEIAGQRCKRRERPWARGLSKQLGRGLEFGFRRL